MGAKIIKNLNNTKERLIDSLIYVLVFSIIIYVFTLLSIVITAIDYKHIVQNTSNLDKSTIVNEREYAKAVDGIDVATILAKDYEKVNSKFIVRMDPEANFSLLYGQ